MKVKDWQEQVDKWIKEFGVRYFDPLTNTTLLMEEVGELASLMARIHGEQSFKEPSKLAQAKDRIADEIADIYFVLTCLANQHGVDLDKALQENINKKTLRDNQRHIDNPKLRQ